MSEQREILFRGKRKNNCREFNGGWNYGDLIHSGDRYFIHPKANRVQVDGELGKIVVMHEIDKSTIGQYTGLKDKNGKRIFEGDIVEFVRDRERNRYEVVWHNAGWCVRECEADRLNDLQDFCSDWWIVIGNLHDNPELLKWAE